MHGPYRDRDALAKAASDFPRPTSHKSKAPAEKLPKIITYNLNGNRVYVAVEENLDDAVDRAYEVFPELSDIPRERITFNVSVRVKGEPAQVTVSRTAWGTIANDLKQYEIIHITILDRPITPSPRLKPKQCDMDANTDASPPPYPPTTEGGQQFLTADPKDHSHTRSGSNSRSPSPHIGLGDRFKNWMKGDED